MKKSDLKTGMLVQTRNGNIYLLINRTLVRSETYLGDIDTEINEDLTHSTGDTNYDIVAVSKIRSGYRLAPYNWTKEELNANLLWRREENTIEITVKVNGKKVPLNSISEETLLSIRDTK